VTDIQILIDTIVDEMRARPDKGRVADYIRRWPMFRNRIRDGGGDGRRAGDDRGDGDEPFSIQSISKVSP
jgi:glutaminase